MLISSITTITITIINITTTTTVDRDSFFLRAWPRLLKPPQPDRSPTLWVLRQLLWFGT
jgi:hypothetical protein